MVEVPVIKAFTHEGRAFVVGDTITVAPVAAAALHRQGLVSLTKGYQTAAIPSPRARKRTRGATYKRRDMRAE